jgi:hypothetical protein
MKESAESRMDTGVLQQSRLMAQAAALPRCAQFCQIKAARLQYR